MFLLFLILQLSVFPYMLFWKIQENDLSVKQKDFDFRQSPKRFAFVVRVRNFNFIFEVILNESTVDFVQTRNTYLPSFFQCIMLTQPLGTGTYIFFNCNWPCHAFITGKYPKVIIAYSPQKIKINIYIHAFVYTYDEDHFVVV